MDTEAEVTLSSSDAAGGVTVPVKLASTRTIRAQIPAGIRDGQQVKFKGMGASGEPTGDLYVRVHVSPPPAVPVFKPEFGANSVGWMLFFSLFFALGLVAGINFTGGWEVLAWVWSAIFGISSTVTAAVVVNRAQNARAVRRYRDRFITLIDLDASTRPLLVKAQDAIATVLGSVVYSRDMIDKAANRVILREQEWETATTLRKISDLRAKVSQATASGPLSLALRESYTRDQDQAQKRVTGRVEALEHYAAQIKVADDAYRDHQHALKLAELNDAHLDLLFGTEVKEQRAISEITDLTRQAFVTRQTLLDTLIEANEAAGMLAIPTLGDPSKRSMAELLIDRSQIHRAAQRYDEAVADLIRAIELAPADAKAFANRGETYRLMGRREEAIVDFTRAIELDANYGWAIGHRGEAYRQMGRREEAIVDFTRAIELDANYGWAIGHRGEAYRQMGRREEAIADFTRAIELDPQDAWAIARRGITHREAGPS